MKESTDDTVEGRRWEVTCLKRKYRNESSFTDSLPTEQRIDDVDDDDIVACLPIPAVHRGIYKFAFDFTQYRVE